MKKIGINLLSILMMAAVCVGFAACGDDDDEDNGGGGGGAGYVRIDGKTYNVSHGYYEIFGGGGVYYIHLYNYDINSAIKNGVSVVPENINYINIEYYASPDGSGMPPAGEYEYNRYALEVNVGKKSELLAGEDYSRRYRPSGEQDGPVLKIQKNGSTYTIQGEEMVYDVWDHKTTQEQSVKGSAFSINCKLEPMPKDY